MINAKEAMQLANAVTDDFEGKKWQKIEQKIKDSANDGLYCVELDWTYCLTFDDIKKITDLGYTISRRYQNGTYIVYWRE